MTATLLRRSAVNNEQFHERHAAAAATAVWPTRIAASKSSVVVIRRVVQCMVRGLVLSVVGVEGWGPL